MRLACFCLCLCDALSGVIDFVTAVLPIFISIHAAVNCFEDSGVDVAQSLKALTGLQKLDLSYSNAKTTYCNASFVLNHVLLIVNLCDLQTMIVREGSASPWVDP